MIKYLLRDNRSHRSFHDKEIKENEILEMLEATRYASSTKNDQIIRYRYTIDRKECDAIFKNIKLGSAISLNPSLEESPRGYILLCFPKKETEYKKGHYFNMGIASQNILLTANELGYHGCIIAKYVKENVHKILNINESYDSYVLIALGKAKDIVAIIDAVDGNTKYYRDEFNNHFVPKLTLDEIILK